ncbi:MAG: spermidine synthase [Pseudomonadota bacterium]
MISSPMFEEIDYCPTPIGALSLRRRQDPVLQKEVYEIKLGEEFLMSTAYTDSEVALATLGLAAIDGEKLDVMVGGLGLGYTALAALETPRTATLHVVEYLAPVIEWHRRGVLPMGSAVADDPRTTFIEGDFFAMAADRQFGPVGGEACLDVLLVDIDHTPDSLLSPHSRPFYSQESLTGVATLLRPNGIFGLWSDEPPETAFLERLEQAFGQAWAEPVTIERPLAGTPIIQTVYLARRRDA